MRLAAEQRTESLCHGEEPCVGTLTTSASTPTRLVDRVQRAAGPLGAEHTPTTLAAPQEAGERSFAQGEGLALAHAGRQRQREQRLERMAVRRLEEGSRSEPGPRRLLRAGLAAGSFAGIRVRHCSGRYHPEPVPVA